MRIVLCGSMSAIDQIEAIAEALTARGHTVVTPQRDERDGAWHDLSSADQIQAKRAFIDAHLDHIRCADAVLLTNFAKNGVEGYVGPNALMEAAFAKALGIPVHLYLEPGEQPAQLELLALQTTCLRGDLSSMPR